MTKKNIFVPFYPLSSFYSKPLSIPTISLSFVRIRYGSYQDRYIVTHSDIMKFRYRLYPGG